MKNVGIDIVEVARIKKLYSDTFVNYLLSDEEKDNIVVKIELQKIRTLKDNIKVGEAKVYLDDELLGKRDIYINKKEEKLSLIEKFKKWINNIW